MVSADHPGQVADGARDHKKKSQFRGVRGQTDTPRTQTRSFRNPHAPSTVALNHGRLQPAEAPVLPTVTLPGARRATDALPIAHAERGRAPADRPSAGKARARD